MWNKIFWAFQKKKKNYIKHLKYFGKKPNIQIMFMTAVTSMKLFT